METLIQNTTIISQNSSREVFFEHDLLIKDGRISDIAKNINAPSECEIIDGSNLVVTPGFINTHVHLGETIFAYLLPENLPLSEYLSLTDQQFVLHPEIEESRELISDYTAAQLITLGTTAICGGRVNKSADKFHLSRISGLTLMNSKKLKKILNSFDSEISSELLENQDGIFIQSLSKVTEQTLKTAQKIIQNNPLLRVVIHVAETQEEESFCRETFGMSSVEVLNKFGLLNENTILVHCNWFSKADWELVALKRSKVVHCPLSNMKCADRVMDLTLPKACRVTWATATDGLGTSGNLDLLEEIKAAYEYRKVISYQELFDSITCNAAKVLGLENDIGSLEIGKRADLVLFKTDNKEELLLKLSSEMISDVYINGKAMINEPRIKQATVEFNSLLLKIKGL